MPTLSAMDVRSRDANPRAALQTGFPADDDLALFVKSMCMAENDVEHALRQAVRANTENRPEFGYWVQVAPSRSPSQTPAFAAVPVCQRDPAGCTRDARASCAVDPGSVTPLRGNGFSTPEDGLLL